APLRGGGARRPTLDGIRGRAPCSPPIRRGGEGRGVPRFGGFRSGLEARRALRCWPAGRARGVPGQGRLRSPEPAARHGRRYEGRDGWARGADRSPETEYGERSLWTRPEWFRSV
ncbi:hypothetical protein AVDCRST_MAG82-3166, partial [uncultured Rubrobacteraceae bacterium]